MENFYKLYKFVCSVDTFTLISCKKADDPTYASPNGEEDSRLFPLLATTFAGLPKTALLAPEHDPNFDENGAYALALQKEGIPVHFHVDHGLPHAHWSVKNNIPSTPLMCHTKKGWLTSPVMTGLPIMQDNLV